MKFPKVIKYRKSEATIYGKSAAYPSYRVAHRTEGKRHIKTFSKFSEALQWAEKKVREIAAGSKLAVLAERQADEAIISLRQLQALYQSTGKKFSLDEAVLAFCSAIKKLGDHSLSDCVDSYIRNLAIVKQKTLNEAVTEFNKGRKEKTVAKDGKRPQLSHAYVYSTSLWLQEFSSTFKNHVVCDLTKEHLDSYITNHKDLSPKTRNERRNVVGMFLRWCERMDYLPQSHRLLEAEGMRPENADPENIGFYRPSELQDLLDNADSDIRAVIALQALGGIRLMEVLRLDWKDIFRVDGHIEISASQSKTRSRRLVEVCASLDEWLTPHKALTGPVWKKSMDMFHIDFEKLRNKLKIPNRRNGLRHGFVTFHYALHADEGLTAKNAGNSPTIVHKNYKGLATKTEAQKWFTVSPQA